MKDCQGFGLVKVFQLVQICTALVVFSYFSYFAFQDFQQEKTGINEFWTSVKKLSLPAITICPQATHSKINSKRKQKNTVKFFKCLPKEFKRPYTARPKDFKQNCKSIQQDPCRIKEHVSRIQNIFCMKS